MTEDILPALQRCERPDAVRSTIFAYFGERGFSRIGFAAPSPSVAGTLTIVERGYPSDMVERYHGNRLHFHDPVLNQALATGRALRWREVARQPGLAAIERDVIDGLLDTDATDGIAIPTFGCAHSVGIVNLSCTANPAAIEMADLPLFEAVAQQAHLRIDQLERAMAPPRPSLSPREREILFWIAQSKSNTDIGTILAISPATIATHLKRIFAKLETCDRRTAIHRALQSAQIWI